MRTVAFALFASLAAASAAAQIGNPAGMTAQTPESAPGEPAPSYPNAQDRLFVFLAGTGGMAEVDGAKAAQKKAQSGAVKAFAQRMEKDHGKANDRLKSLARKADIPMPKELDPDHKAMRAQLDSASRSQFDLAYIQGQIVDHQKTIQILLWEMTQGQDAQLQRYAAETLPDVVQHLEMAQMAMHALTGAGPQGLAAAAPAPSASAGASR